MQVRTIVCLLAIGTCAFAQAGRFDVVLLEHSGNYAGSITAVYAAPTMNLIQAQPAFRVNSANQLAIHRIVTEGSANDNWWFTGERFLTFDGSCWWSGGSNESQHVKLTSRITDLDHGHVYVIESRLDRNGSSWAQDLVFFQPTKNVRWEDTIELATGPTGTISEWLATRHTMEMAPLVPEPASIFGVVLGAALVFRRRPSNG